MKDMKSNFSEDTEETAIIHKERAIQDIAYTEVIIVIREHLIMLFKNMRSI